MLGKDGVYGDFLLTSDQVLTYALGQVLHKSADGLHVDGLSRAGLHALDVCFHRREVRLLRQNTNHQHILHRDVLVVVRLQLTRLLGALLEGLRLVAKEKWRLDHVENVEIVVHCKY